MSVPVMEGVAPTVVSVEGFVGPRALVLRMGTGGKLGDEVPRSGERIVWTRRSSAAIGAATSEGSVERRALGA